MPHTWCTHLKLSLIFSINSNTDAFMDWPDALRVFILKE